MHSDMNTKDKWGAFKEVEEEIITTVGGNIPAQKPLLKRKPKTQRRQKKPPSAKKPLKRNRHLPQPLNLRKPRKKRRRKNPPAAA